MIFFDSRHLLRREFFVVATGVIFTPVYKPIKSNLSEQEENCSKIQTRNLVSQSFRFNTLKFNIPAKCWILGFKSVGVLALKRIPFLSLLKIAVQTIFDSL